MAGRGAASSRVAGACAGFRGPRGAARRGRPLRTRGRQATPPARRRLARGGGREAPPAAGNQPFRGTPRIPGRLARQTSRPYPHPAHHRGTARQFWERRGAVVAEGQGRARTTPAPSRTRRIGTLRFNFRRAERITTSQRMRPTLRWRAAFWRNENRRLQGAKANWRQPLPNPWKRGSQLGVPIRPDSEEFPIPVKGRQTHPRTGPRMARRHHPATSV
ncbi:hypothetical protein TcBrA4_0127210 [Trypanosoma cruzi]|nr:hypothetical protein TcBrA4_0127210 [Trypanosoma cruzi]